MRNFGTNTYSNNFEPLVNGVLDARTKIEGPASDLTLDSTWVSSDGNVWVCSGLVVSVINDPDDSKNGLYLLLNDDYTQISNWKFIGNNQESYTLPTASTTVKGGVKIGAGLTMNGEVLSATGGGTADSVDWANIQQKPNWITDTKPTYTYSEILSKPSTYPSDWNTMANKPTIPQLYVLPAATGNTLGGIKVGEGLNIDNNGILSVDNSGEASSIEWSEILNKPSFSTVATSGSYNDLSNKPVIPTKLPNPNSITFQGAVTGSYDGSLSMTVNIPSSDNKLITISINDLLQVVGEGVTTEQIIQTIGQDNIDALFAEGKLYVEITGILYTLLGEDTASSYFTERNLFASNESNNTKIASIDLMDGRKIVFATDGTNILITEEISSEYDDTLNGVSTNAPQTKVVYEAINDVKSKFVVLYTTDLFLSTRTTNINLSSTEVNKLKSFGSTDILQYNGTIDNKPCRLTVNISIGTTISIGNTLQLFTVVDGIPLCVDVYYSAENTMVAYPPVSYAFYESSFTYDYLNNISTGDICTSDDYNEMLRIWKESNKRIALLKGGSELYELSFVGVSPLLQVFAAGGEYNLPDTIGFCFMNGHLQYVMYINMYNNKWNKYIIDLNSINGKNSTIFTDTPTVDNALNEISYNLSSLPYGLGTYYLEATINVEGYTYFINDVLRFKVGNLLITSCIAASVDNVSEPFINVIIKYNYSNITIYLPLATSIDATLKATITKI